MIRSALFVLVVTFVFASCGSKTQSKVVDVDPAAAKAKFGEGFSQQQLQQLMQAEGVKSDADKVFAEGESFLAKAKEFEDKANAEEAPEKKQWHMQRAQKAYDKAYKKQIEASKSYAQANQISYSTYRKACTKLSGNVQDYIRTAAAEAEDASKTHFNLAAKKRADAENTEDLKKKQQLLREANELEFLAVDEQQRALDIYRGKIHVEEPVVETTEPVAVEPAYEEPEEVSQTYGQTTYKIQIAASQDELPIATLKEIYQPKPGELINNEIEDGWYKYAVGKFETYAEAQAYKEEIGVEGAFIIAYKEDEKIILPEIQEKIARGEMSEPPKRVASGNVASQTDLIYKVQIAATKIPARPSQLNQMYHGKQIVSIVKSRGWYKYTVGNFDDRAKAEAFKSEAGLPDAFVVAFTKDGREVPLK